MPKRTQFKRKAGNWQRSLRSTTDSLHTREIISALDLLRISTSVKPNPGVRDIQKVVLKPHKSYTVKNNYFQQNIVTSNAVSTFGTVAIQLTNLPKYTSYTNVFDAYRFIQATVRFVPLTPANPGVGNTPLLTVIDYDDSSTPSSTSSMRSYDTLYETPFGAYQERTFSPKYAVATYSGAFTSFSQANGWCDIASSNIQWYGLKYGIDTTAATYTAYSVEVECIIQFRSTR